MASGKGGCTPRADPPLGCMIVTRVRQEVPVQEGPVMGAQSVHRWESRGSTETAKGPRRL
jgi:hypothetical protein